MNEASETRTESWSGKWTEQRLLDIHPWAPGLFSFRTSRDADFNFAPGQFARLGLNGGDGEAVTRAYSIVSAPDQDFLEFFTVLIPGGAFSQALERCRPGDSLYVERDTYGFLTADSFRDGESLWLMATGTGLAPFISMLRQGSILQRFSRVVAVHSVRRAAELAYREELEGLVVRGLCYQPVVTREEAPDALPARIQHLIEDGRLEASTQTPLTPERSRLMICGNPQMCADLRALLTARGFRVNRRLKPGQLIFENYW